MFNRRKTPRLTGDLWKFPPEPLRGHRSGVHAPDGQQNPTPWPIVAPRHPDGPTSALPRPVSDPDEPPLTAPVNGCAVLCFAAPIRVTGFSVAAWLAVMAGR